MGKKLRPLGEITDDMEPYLQEMAYDHKMQMHEILAIIHKYLLMHTDAEERFKDGTKPVFYYGHQSGLSTKP